VVLFFGHTPESYKSHHLGMHHIENNLEEDGSSTLPYQRDSFTEFLKYYFRFLLRGVADLFIYLLARKKKKYYMPLSIGEITYFIACTGLCFVNLRATLCVFIIPLLVTRLVMMLGNWTQHAFNDPSNPSNLYTNNINCINTKYNTKCWNDGYHLIHHLKPGIHYTEHPIVFKKELPKIAAEKSFVFDGIHYLHLFYYLMTKRYDKMAFHLVNINNAFSSDEEAMHLLKERTQKIAISS
jgi:fatty acid desaturase